MSALAGPGEALLLYARVEAGQGTAAASEAGLKVAESGRVACAGAGAVVAGAVPRD